MNNEPKKLRARGKPFIGITGVYEFIHRLEGKHDNIEKRHQMHGKHKRYRRVKPERL